MVHAAGRLIQSSQGDKGPICSSPSLSCSARGCTHLPQQVAWLKQRSSMYTAVPCIEFYTVLTVLCK